MYKLIMIKGPEPEKAFDLRNGTFLIGRNPDCDIHLQSELVSKKHATLIVSENQVILEDLNSRNGTFVNGMMVRKTSLKPGDRISFQEIILELRHEKTKKRTATPPSKSKEKPSKSTLWQLFDPMMNKITEIIEWKYLMLILVFIFSLGTFVAIVPSLLNEAKVKLQAEALKRGKFIVKNIARSNQKHLSFQNNTLVYDHLKVSTSLAQSEERILQLNIINPKTKRIIAPPQRLNQSIDNRAPIIRGSDTQKLIIEKMSTNRILISQPIYIYSSDEKKDIVGATVQAVFDIEGIGLSANEYSGILLRSLIFILLLATIFYVFLQKFTSAAFQKIHDEIETATRKGYRHLEISAKFDEASKIVHAINKAFKRTRDVLEKLPEESRLETEKDIENTDEILKNLLSSLPEGVVILDKAFHIQQINNAFQAIAGFKHQPQSDKNILDLIQDQELLRNISHGLGQAAHDVESNEELFIQKDKYHLSISATKKPNSEIDFYIVNLRQVE